MRWLVALLLLVLQTRHGLTDDADGQADLAAARRAIMLQHINEIEPLLLKSARAGNIEAAGLLGLYYVRDGSVRNDTDGKRDYRSAFPWLLKAANGGEAKAMGWIATFYYNGFIGPKDKAIGKQWSNKSTLADTALEPAKRAAAEKGDVSAQLWLGHYYETNHYYETRQSGTDKWKISGEGSNRNLAVFWYKKAAAQNSIEALRALSSGRLTDNEADSFAWAMKGAVLGDPQMQYLVGVDYLVGSGVTRDPAEAEKWLRIAAAQEYSIAQSELGKTYADGSWGIPQNFREARLWLGKAAAFGDKNAAKRVAGLAQKETQAAKEKAEHERTQRLCGGDPGIGQKGQADRQSEILLNISDCKQAAERFHVCQWGSTMDTGFASIVLQTCEKDFQSHLSPEGRKSYALERKLCGKQYADQQGTLYISEAAGCAVDVAARYATTPTLWNKAAPRASFDCARAKAPIEKAICGDEELGEDDILLNRTYRAALTEVDKVDRPRFVAVQKAWMDAVIALCQSSNVSREPNGTEAATCLRKQFERRFSQITGCSESGDMVNCAAIKDMSAYLAGKDDEDTSE